MTPWIEAMRLRTLPVSVAGVLAGTAYAAHHHKFQLVPMLLCLTFAVLAQIASNFANEYYDYRAGVDRPGREGPRRGVTEGDITPQAMKRATLLTLGMACAVGLGLVAYGGWWLIGAGAVIAVGALAYSAGPYPLSRHALGEVAVVIFFGLVPVTLTYYVQARSAVPSTVFLGALAIGLLAANVLVVNNYRDIPADREVGKHTLATLLGRKYTSWLYLANGVAAFVITAPEWVHAPVPAALLPLLYIGIHILFWRRIRALHGSKLNPILGATALLLLYFSASLFAL